MQKIMIKRLFFRLVRIYKQTGFVRIVLAEKNIYSYIVQFCCLPPHGGSGLKSWNTPADPATPTGLPPHGGSGLKLLSELLYRDILLRLPPHGGSGLKSYKTL